MSMNRDRVEAGAPQHAAGPLLAFRDLVSTTPQSSTPDFDDFAPEPCSEHAGRVAACVVCGCWPTDPASGCESTCPCHELFD